MKWLSLVVLVVLASCSDKPCEGGHMATFEPKPDITAYELALILKNTSGYGHNRYCNVKAPPEIMRHFHIDD